MQSELSAPANRSSPLKSRTPPKLGAPLKKTRGDDTLQLQSLPVDVLGHIGDYLSSDDKQNTGLPIYGEPMKDSDDAFRAIDDDFTVLESIANGSSKYPKELLDSPSFIEDLLDVLDELDEEKIDRIVRCAGPHVFHHKGPVELALGSKANFTTKERVVAKMGHTFFNDYPFMSALFRKYPDLFFFDCELRNDLAFMLRLLNESPAIFTLRRMFNNKICGKKEFVLAALEKLGANAICLIGKDSPLIGDSDFLRTVIFTVSLEESNLISNVVEFQPHLMEYFSDSFFEDEGNLSFIMHVADESGNKESLIAILHQKPKSFILETMKKNPSILRYANRGFFDDKAFVEAAKNINEGAVIAEQRALRS